MGYYHPNKPRYSPKNYPTRDKKHLQKNQYSQLCDKLSGYLATLETILTDDTNKLYEFVDMLLTTDECYEQLFGTTSKTAYRRIHDLLISILDQLEYMSKQSQEKVSIDLARAKTIIHYQSARNHLKKGKCEAADAKKFLDKALGILHKHIRSGKGNIGNLISSTRTLLDAFVVVVERNAKS